MFSPPTKKHRFNVTIDDLVGSARDVLKLFEEESLEEAKEGGLMNMDMSHSPTRACEMCSDVVELTYCDAMWLCPACHASGISQSVGSMDDEDELIPCTEQSRSHKGLSSSQLMSNTIKMTTPRAPSESPSEPLPSPDSL